MSTAARIALVSMLVAGVPALAASTQRLEPLSKTAESITGPIVLEPDALVIGKRVVLKLTPGGQVRFDRGGGLGTVTANLFRFVTTSDPLLLHGNHLCGQTPLRSMLVWYETGISGPVTSLAVSTSAASPASMADICATFSYVPAN